MSAGLWLLGALMMLVMANVAWAQGNDAKAASTPGASLQPVIEKARGGACVADPAFMRRNHMKMLRHQRDDTLRSGIRGGAFSLKECIVCHASQTTNSVNASSGNFCQSCHAYAAVSIDCFECHASKPGSTATAALTSQGKP